MAQHAYSSSKECVCHCISLEILRIHEHVHTHTLYSLPRMHGVAHELTWSICTYLRTCKWQLCIHVWCTKHWVSDVSVMQFYTPPLPHVTLDIGHNYSPRTNAHVLSVSYILYCIRIIMYSKGFSTCISSQYTLMHSTPHSSQSTGCENSVFDVLHAH